MLPLVLRNYFHYQRYMSSFLSFYFHPHMGNMGTPTLVLNLSTDGEMHGKKQEARTCSNESMYGWVDMCSAAQYLFEDSTDASWHTLT